MDEGDRAQEREASAGRATRVCYTVNIGRYDAVPKSDQYAHLKRTGWDVVLFTDDRAARSDGVRTVVHVPVRYGSPRLTSKDYKIRSHLYLDAAYERVLFTDCNLIPRAPLIAALEAQIEAGHDMACIRHPWRRCAYAEAAEVVSSRLDTAERVGQQMDRYRLRGFPTDAGLVASGCFMRRGNNPALRQFCERWFQEVMCGSLRDQTSFNYVAWSLPPERGGPRVSVSGLWGLLHPVSAHRRPAAAPLPADAARLSVERAFCRRGTTEVDVTEGLAALVAGACGQALFVSSGVPLLGRGDGWGVVGSEAECKGAADLMAADGRGVLVVRVRLVGPRPVAIEVPVEVNAAGVFLSEDLVMRI